MLRPVLGVALTLVACGSGADPAALDGTERAALEAVLAPGDTIGSLQLYTSVDAFRCRGIQDAADNRASDANGYVAVGGHIVALRLSRTHVRELRRLNEIAFLQCLVLQGDDLASADGVLQLRNLEHLDVGGNHLQSLGAVQLPLLESLYAPGNQLTTIPDLHGSPALEELNLAWNAIPRMTGLASLRRLRVLSLEGNPIERMSDLDTLASLQYLNLSFTRVETVEDVDGLKDMRCLNLWHSRAVNVDAVAKLDRLVYLGVGENPPAGAASNRAAGDRLQGRGYLSSF